MSIAISTTEEVNEDFDLSLRKYDEDLREWGDWNRANVGSLPDLGFPKVNILHPTHGLGGRSADDKGPSERVKEVDKIIHQLPQVMRRVAFHFWVYNDTKSDICIRMTSYFGRNERPRNVKSYHVDQWVDAVAMSVWFGIDRGRGKL